MEAPLKKDEERIQRWASIARAFVEGHSKIYLKRVFGLEDFQVDAFGRRWNLTKYRKGKIPKQLRMKLK